MLAAHVRALALEQLRSPVTLAGNLLLPVAGLPCYLVLFPPVDSLDRAQVLARFLVLAVTTPALFTVLFTLASDRESAWGHYLRTLPVAGWVRPLAVVLVALGTAGVAAVLVVLTGLVLGLLPGAAVAVAAGFVTLVPVAGSVALLGVALGRVLALRAALAVGQGVFLVLVFGGGLLLPPESVTALAGFPRWVVTGAGAQTVAAVFVGHPVSRDLVGCLGAWSSVTAGAAVLCHRARPAVNEPIG